MVTLAVQLRVTIHYRTVEIEGTATDSVVSPVLTRRGYMPMFDDLIGTPFANNGRNIKTGVDCYGLCMEVFRRYGIRIPEY